MKTQYFEVYVSDFTMSERKEQASQRMREIHELLKSVDISDVQHLRNVLEGVFSDILSSKIAIYDCFAVASDKLKSSTFASWIKRKVSLVF